MLASSHEGWPNGLCESQAYGLPSVATNAWGIGEILHEPALGQPWGRAYIAEVGGRRAWDTVAEEVERVFQGVA